MFIKVEKVQFSGFWSKGLSSNIRNFFPDACNKISPEIISIDFFTNFQRVATIFEKNWNLVFSLENPNFWVTFQFVSQ